MSESGHIKPHPHKPWYYQPQPIKRRVLISDHIPEPHHDIATGKRNCVRCSRPKEEHYGYKAVN